MADTAAPQLVPPEGDAIGRRARRGSDQSAKLILLALMAAGSIVGFWDLYVLVTDMLH